MVMEKQNGLKGMSLLEKQHYLELIIVVLNIHKRKIMVLCLKKKFKIIFSINNCLSSSSFEAVLFYHKH